MAFFCDSIKAAFDICKFKERGTLMTLYWSCQNPDCQREDSHYGNNVRNLVYGCNFCDRKWCSYCVDHNWLYCRYDDDEPLVVIGKISTQLEWDEA